MQITRFATQPPDKHGVVATMDVEFDDAAILDVALRRNVDPATGAAVHSLKFESGRYSRRPVVRLSADAAWRLRRMAEARLAVVG